MKVIVFGVGNYYRKQKEKLNSFSDIEITAFADNNISLWDKEIDGKIVISPDLIQTVEYDKIMIMNIYVGMIYEQLLTLGVDKDKIIIWERFCAESVQGKRAIFPRKPSTDHLKKSVLIISAALGYNGGTLAAVYAALSLKQRGISIVLAAPKGDEKLIEEITDRKIDVVIWSSLPYIFDTDRIWIQQFEIVIVNTLQMMECAFQIIKICPMMWWVHEPLEMYAPLMMKYPTYKSKDQLEYLNIYAVSKIAQENFNQSFNTHGCKKILTLGIPDKVNIVKKRMHDAKIVFAIIGNVYSLKAQDIFLKAASMLDCKEELEFWIIGKMYHNEYCKNIRKMAFDISSVKILGELDREEIDNLFSDIDVLVCTSLEETLSLTVVEAMMYGKICITTDTTGVAEYVRDGVNGFVIPCNNVNALREKMEWIIDNINKLESIKVNARKTYEKYFNMDVFGENLTNALSDIKQEKYKV